MKAGYLVISVASAFAIFSVSALAQQVTGVPGSPSATTTVTGNQLPAPDPKFGGVIKDDALQSKPWWAPRVDVQKSITLHARPPLGVLSLASSFAVRQ
jgi:hypothetical protein